jgi:hypothetical protein
LICAVDYTLQYSSFTLCFWPDSEPTKLLHHPKQMTSKDNSKGLVSLSSLVHATKRPTIVFCLAPKKPLPSYVRKARTGDAIQCELRVERGQVQ